MKKFLGILVLGIGLIFLFILIFLSTNPLFLIAAANAVEEKRSKTKSNNIFFIHKLYIKISDRTTIAVRVLLCAFD